jgi:hypothetical protein
MQAERIDALLGCLLILSEYAELEMTEEEFEVMIGTVQYLIRFTNSFDDTHRLRLVRHTLAIINGLIDFGTLSPIMFNEFSFGAFVDHALRNGDDISKLHCCEIWTTLVKHGSTWYGMPLSHMIGLIISTSGRVSHSAFRVVETILRESPHRQEFGN